MLDVCVALVWMHKSKGGNHRKIAQLLIKSRQLHLVLRCIKAVDRKPTYNSRDI